MRIFFTQCEMIFSTIYVRSLKAQFPIHIGMPITCFIFLISHFLFVNLANNFNPIQIENKKIKYVCCLFQINKNLQLFVYWGNVGTSNGDQHI